MMTTIPAAALWLGGTGLIPFIAPVVALWLGSPAWREPAWAVLHGYAAIILSFLGAVHWGAALRDNDPGRLWQAMGWSVVPALLAWVTLMLPHRHGVALLLLTLGWLPAWYGRLRRALTAGVTACLALALVSGG
ncbi:MAG: DUF3429 domain-containing protein [Candidatus Contendobacter sp.]|nr:DUF3429 domain-containing protein [Candidatus Contendobacter sp.]